jgi:hypothetical protein
MTKTSSTTTSRSKHSMKSIEFDLIDIAPAPGFTGLERTHNRMSGFMEMYGGMLIF